MRPAQDQPAGDTALRRALSRWDLAAIGVNQVIGASIFLIPSLVAAQIGAWSALATIVTGLAALAIALCYAEVGSRFERTGGAYAYVRPVLGRFAAFEIGWMGWFTRVATVASIVNGIAVSLGYFEPVLAHGAGRMLVITLIVGLVTLVNLRGIRQSARAVNLLTLAKLAPLAVFITIGLAFAQWERLTPLPRVDAQQAGAAALLLIFAFAGFEVIGVPAGESRDPRRDLPFAVFVTMATVITVMTLAQITAMATLPDLARSGTPLADAAATFLGPFGAAMISVGAVVSMIGNLHGSVLSGSRMLFALAEDGEIPAQFTRVDGATHIPTRAILFTGGVGLALALSGSFVLLAMVSAVARIATYAGVCLAALLLRRADGAGIVAPAAYKTSGGPIVPLFALLICGLLAASATPKQLLIGAGASIFGAALFLVNALRHGHARPEPSAHFAGGTGDGQDDRGTA